MSGDFIQDLVQWARTDLNQADNYEETIGEMSGEK